MANRYVYSGAAGSGDGSSWTNAYTTLAAALAAGAAGDYFYLAHDHAESSASTITLAPPGTASNWCYVLCVNRAGSVPPVSADLRTTATVSTTAASDLFTGGGYCYWRGITFAAGNSASLAALGVVTAAGHHIYDRCNLTLTGTSSSSLVQIGGSLTNNNNRCDLVNSSIGFYRVNQSVSIRNTRLQWSGGGGLLTSGSYVVPTDLFRSPSRGGTAIMTGLDLSAAGTGKTLIGTQSDPVMYYFIDCKLSADVAVTGALGSQGGPEVYLTRCGSGAVNYQQEKHQYAGSLTTITNTVRTSGASNGVTSIAHKIITSSGASSVAPFEGLPIAAYNSTVGSSVGVTVEGVINAAAIPKNDEVWLDVEYLSDTGSPLGAIASGFKADVLATGANLTASTEAWDSGAPARQNSTAYTVGDVIKLASNPGRVFFCTTAGTSGASEPAGYASAVDGGSVTDGAAAFRAGVRFKQTVSVTPDIAGHLFIRPRVGKGSTTVIIDPKAAFS